jgi:hypothetical protein
MICDECGNLLMQKEINAIVELEDIKPENTVPHRCTDCFLKTIGQEVEKETLQ